MPLGVLDDQKLDHVPGTSTLNELGHVGLDDAEGVDSSFLKHDPTGTFVLIPQPSDSPNDPYNWPRWRKMMYTVAIGYGCGCVGGMFPALTVPLFPFSFSFTTPLEDIELTISAKPSVLS